MAVIYQPLLTPSPSQPCVSQRDVVLNRSHVMDNNLTMPIYNMSMENNEDKFQNSHGESFIPLRRSGDLISHLISTILFPRIESKKRCHLD